MCNLKRSALTLSDEILLQYSERIVEHKFASFVVERLYSAKKRILAARKKRLEQEQQRAAAARRQSYKLLTTAITPHTSPPDAGETSGSSKSLTSVLKKRRSMPLRGSEQNIADAPSSNTHGRLASSPDAPTLQPSPMTISPETVNPQSELPATTAAQSTTSPVNSHDEVYNDSDAASIASETTRRNKAGKRFGSFNFLAAVKDVTKIDTIMRQTRGVFGNMGEFTDDALYTIITGAESKTGIG